MRYAKALHILFLLVLLVSNLQAWAQSEGQIATSALPNTRPGSTKAPVTSLRQALKNNWASFKLQGDGVTTSKVRLILENKIGKTLRIVIPANEVFHPDPSKNVQKMMTTKDTIFELAVGQSTIVEIPTICASYKSVPPPPESGVNFQVGDYQDKDVWKKLSAIIYSAEKLFHAGAFDAVPIGTKDNRKDQIAQLAIWKILGENSTSTKDKVNRESIAAGLIRELAEQCRKNPEFLKKLGADFSLTPEGQLTVTGKQKEILDKRVDQIFSAIDLTINRSADPALKPPTLPQDSIWDTFTNVGERAFDRGDYIEAEELLGSAVQESEKFGESDPRLSRNLNSLGKTYLELAWIEKADSFLTRALRIREKLFGSSSPEYAETATNMGLLKQLQNLFDDATIYFEKALAIFEKSAKATSELVERVLNDIGRNFNLKKEGEKAEPVLKRALAIAYQIAEENAVKNGVYKKDSPAADTHVAEIECNLACSYDLQNKHAEAERLYNRALSTSLAQLGDDHLYVATILENFANNCEKQDRTQDAETWKKKAESIRDTTLGRENALVASLPYSSDAFSRIMNYSKGAKGIRVSVDQLRSASRNLPGASTDKSRINRPIKDKWALVIGVSKFKDSSINLQYASKDAKDFAKFLVDKANFKPGHVRLLTDEQATRENILATLGDKWLPHAATQDDLVLIYISSHGSPSAIDVRGANYLLAHNTDKNNLFATGIAITELSKLIKDRCASDRTIVFLDACHSGAATISGGKGLFKINNFNAQDIAQGSGQLVVCSSDPSQISWESKRYPNGVFTHHLMSALSLNGEKTKLKDAYEYLRDKVQEEVSRDRGFNQSPVLKTKWDGDDMMLSIPPTVNRPDYHEPGGTSNASTSTGTAKPAVKAHPLKHVTGKKK